MSKHTASTNTTYAYGLRYCSEQGTNVGTGDSSTETFQHQIQVVNKTIQVKAGLHSKVLRQMVTIIMQVTFVAYSASTIFVSSILMQRARR